MQGTAPDLWGSVALGLLPKVHRVYLVSEKMRGLQQPALDARKDLLLSCRVVQSPTLTVAPTHLAGGHWAGAGPVLSQGPARFRRLLAFRTLPLRFAPLCPFATGERLTK